jgi:hypothetical protein
MGAGVDLPQGIDVDMRVDLGRFQSLVTQHVLDVANVRASTVHVRRAGMTEQMTGAQLVDAASLHQALDPVPKVGGGDPGAVAAQKHRCLPRLMIEKRPGLGQEAIQPSGSTLRALRI